MSQGRTGFLYEEPSKSLILMGDWRVSDTHYAGETKTRARIHATELIAGNSQTQYTQDKMALE